MSLVEINFDGIVGPSHNYAGLSAGNLASASNAGAISHPRAAALQGIEKMRANMALGLAQGFFLPHDRPDVAWLASIGSDPDHAEPHIRAAALSASAMWAANAATVSPAPDTDDGRCHLTPANLMTMAHRAHEWPGTLAQLKLAFAHPAFAIHAPIPAPFGDEGAANHMRLCREHSAPGIEVFVYGVRGGRFPARQHIEASKAVARLHGVNSALFVAQSEAAIAAGAFHNDVVAVANERVLFTHEQAFEDKAQFYGALQERLPEVEIIEVPADVISLGDAISSYLFNAQLVTLPAGGGMALILPNEAQDNARVWAWLQSLIAGNGPIRRLVPVDLRESMANGGGPACLRLRVVADPTTVDRRFMADTAKLEMIGDVVERHWPKTMEPGDLGNSAVIEGIRRARAALISALSLPELSS
ncbi:N-succinylarginine dihydrolase [Sphingomonas sp.]|uniref:N-succinylarginine dihydrolase n=1 Tax=Sphingomonas sp. TaxID=28214 RepID=UPI0025DAFC23|nr:N-succinylarginine dihydrolase [Sphingomonas sp.]